jgi:hypothetical protein
MLLHSLGLVYKSMRGMMTNSVDRDQWLNVTKKIFFIFLTYYYYYYYYINSKNLFSIFIAFNCHKFSFFSFVNCLLTVLKQKIADNQPLP